MAWEPCRRRRGAASERAEMAGRQVEQVIKPTHQGLGHWGRVSRAVASWGVGGLRPGLGNPRAPGRTGRMGRAPRHPPPESMEKRPPSPRTPGAPNALWAFQTALRPPIRHPGPLAPWRAEHSAARGEAAPLATPSIPAAVQGGPGGVDRPGTQGSDSGCLFPQRSKGLRRPQPGCWRSHSAAPRAAVFLQPPSQSRREDSAPCRPVRARHSRPAPENCRATAAQSRLLGAGSRDPAPPLWLGPAPPPLAPPPSQ